MAVQVVVTALARWYHWYSNVVPLTEVVGATISVKSAGSSPLHTVMSVELIVPAVSNSFSARVIVVMTGVPLQFGSVARTEIDATPEGGTFGIT